MTNIIADFLAKLDDTSINTDKQEEKLTEISSKLSTYKNHINKSYIKKYYSHFQSRSIMSNMRNYIYFIQTLNL